MLERAEQLIPPLLLPKLPPSKPKWSTEPEWRAFKYALWRLGEEIRQVTARYKAARFTPEQLRRVLAVAAHPHAQRGRQSFILLLGYKKYQDCAAALARQLADPDVTGRSTPCTRCGPRAMRRRYGRICRTAMCGGTPSAIWQNTATGKSRCSYEWIRHGCN